MATAELRRERPPLTPPPARPRSRRDGVVRLVVVAALAAVLAVVVMARDGGSGPAGGSGASAGSSGQVEGPLLAVDAVSVHHFTDLDTMTRASDLVVVGTVVATERGRLVGDPAAGGVISRFVTLQVDQLLWGPSGTAPANVAGTVPVEEEGWLPDGTPIAVNGMAPSTVGDRGVWFLEQGSTGEQPSFVVINEQGRYLDAPVGTIGADHVDPLIEALERRSIDDLAALVPEAPGP